MYSLVFKLLADLSVRSHSDLDIFLISVTLNSRLED